MTLPTGWNFLVEDIIPDVLLYAIIFVNCYDTSKSEKNIFSQRHKDTEETIPFFLRVSVPL